MNTAIVTGSTKGIGKATSMLLAKSRFNVVVSSRTVYYADSVVCETNLTLKTTHQFVTKDKKLQLWRSFFSSISSVIGLVDKILLNPSF